MTHAPHLTTGRFTAEQFTAEYLHTLIAHMRLWVLEVALWFAELCGDSPMGDALRANLRDDLHLCRRCLAATLLLLAMRRRAPPPRTRTSRRPPNAPRGYRRPHNLHGSFRAFTRRVPGGRSLRARCAALRAAADNAEAGVARMVALLDATPVAAYILVSAPCERRVAPCVPQPVIADSS